MRHREFGAAAVSPRIPMHGHDASGVVHFGDAVASDSLNHCLRWQM
jgi:hypothetical protein